MSDPTRGGNGKKDRVRSRTLEEMNEDQLMREAYGNRGAAARKVARIAGEGIARADSNATANAESLGQKVKRTIRNIFD